MRKTLALALALTLGWGIVAAAQLKGSWCTDVAIATQSASIQALSSTVIVDFDVGGWVFESKSGLTLAGWSTQQFTAGGLLGGLRISSTLLFSPQTASFTSWTVNGSLPIEGLTLTGRSLVGPGGSGWTLGGVGTVGDVTADVAIYLNMNSSGALVRQTDCSVCWDGLKIHLCFPFACLKQVCATINVDTSGFKDVQFCATGIPVPPIDWLSLSACADFTVTTKSVSLTPSINMPAGCLTLYASITTDPGVALSITALNIYGFGFTSTLGGVTFTDGTSLDPAKNSTVTGYSAYWEKMRLSSVTDSCCGAFNFDVSVWFSKTGAQLFGFGMTSLSLSLGLSTNSSFTTGVTITTLGLVEWDVGFCLKW